MSDDSFIREVEEELRSDRFKALWTRFGPLIVGGAVLIVAATAGWRGYLAWSESRANAAGDRYLEAVELADDGKETAALALLGELEADAPGRYDLIARLRAASLRAGDDPQAAIDALEAVASDAGTPDAIADIARLRAAYLAVDHADAARVESLVGSLTGPDDPMRHSAREALGLAALKAGDMPGAATRFRTVLADPAAPQGVAARAGEMLALIAARGGLVDAGPAPAGEPPSAAAAAGGTVTDDPVGAVIEGREGAGAPAEGPGGEDAASDAGSPGGVQ